MRQMSLPSTGSQESLRWPLVATLPIVSSKKVVSAFSKASRGARGPFDQSRLRRDRREASAFEAADQRTALPLPSPRILMEMVPLPLQVSVMFTIPCTLGGGRARRPPCQAADRYPIPSSNVMPSPARTHRSPRQNETFVAFPLTCPPKTGPRMLGVLPGERLSGGERAQGPVYRGADCRHS